MNRMGWGSARTSANRNSLLPMLLNTRTFSSLPDVQTLHGFLRHVPRHARRQYAKKIVDAYPGAAQAEHCVPLCVSRYCFSGALEQARHSRACAVMEAGDCVLVHARLRSIQRILPRSKCA